MIGRIWRGTTRAQDADAYLAYLEKTGLPDYEATPGNRGVLVLRRLQEETAEFLLLSFWEDFDAVRRFAGPQPEKAVYYLEDERFLLGKEPNVTHYEVAANREAAPAQAEARRRTSVR
jgi:heme-degrading monooxygenase HmoA